MPDNPQPSNHVLLDCLWHIPSSRITHWLDPGFRLVENLQLGVVNFSPNTSPKERIQWRQSGDGGYDCISPFRHIHFTNQLVATDEACTGLPSCRNNVPNKFGKRKVFRELESIPFVATNTRLHEVLSEKKQNRLVVNHEFRTRR